MGPGVNTLTSAFYRCNQIDSTNLRTPEAQRHGVRILIFYLANYTWLPEHVLRCWTYIKPILAAKAQTLGNVQPSKMWWWSQLSLSCHVVSQLPLNNYQAGGWETLTAARRLHSNSQECQSRWWSREPACYWRHYSSAGISVEGGNQGWGGEVKYFVLQPQNVRSVGEQFVFLAPGPMPTGGWHIYGHTCWETVGGWIAGLKLFRQWGCFDWMKAGCGVLCTLAA